MKNKIYKFDLICYIVNNILFYEWNIYKYFYRIFIKMNRVFNYKENFNKFKEVESL